VDTDWLFVAYAPDAVDITLRGDRRSVEFYDHLFPYLQLYEALALRFERTNIRFAVVEVDDGIHIIRNPSTGPNTACSTTYTDALEETQSFLVELFERLEESNTNRAEVESLLNSRLQKLTLSEIASEVRGS